MTLGEFWGEPRGNAEGGNLILFPLNLENEQNGTDGWLLNKYKECHPDYLNVSPLAF